MLEKHDNATLGDKVINTEDPNQLEDKQQMHGLRGGGRYNTAEITRHKTTDHLQLLNRRNDCFVNSTIQLLKITHYGIFLKNKFEFLLDDEKDDDYKVSKALSKLFNKQTRGQVSTDSIRKYVAQKSEKMDHNKMQKNFSVLLKK